MPDPKQDPAAWKEWAHKRVYALEQELLASSKDLERALDGRRSLALYGRQLKTVFLKGGHSMFQVTLSTFVQAAIEAAELNLIPGSALGECYILPIKKKGRMMAELRFGYRGYMKLGRRDGKIDDIDADVVFANDRFIVRRGTDPGIEHIPWYSREDRTFNEPGQLKALAYATARYADTGYRAFAIATPDRIALAKAKSGNPWKPDEPSSIWLENEVPMMKKTAIRELFKYLPLPDDVRRVIQRAEAREEGHEEPADGVIDTTATERREGEGGTSLDDLLDMHDGEEVFDDELEGDGEGQPEEGSEAPTEAG